MDAYTLPAFRTLVRHDTTVASDSAIFGVDYAVDTTIGLVNDDGEVVDEMDGIILFF